MNNADAIRAMVETFEEPQKKTFVEMVIETTDRVLKRVRYRAMCDEHKLPLKQDGTCPVCRDAAGNPFVLDMQSTYLEPISSSVAVKSAGEGSAESK